VNDERNGYPGAPPGWYPDPAGGPGQRWWDGYAWNEAVILPTPPPPPGGSGTGYVTPGYVPPTPYGPNNYYRAPDPRTLAADEFRLSPIARIAFAVPGVYLLVNLITLRSNAGEYRTFGHDFHLAMQAAQNNQPAPVLNVPNQFNGSIAGLSTVVGLCTVAAVVFACIWQFRAASTARALGYPAHHRPGWGVAFWFIPIVSYWMPYQAIRDTLPIGDPHRPLVLRWWLAVIASQTLGGAAVCTALFSTSASLVVSLFGGISCLAVVMTAPRVVMAVTQNHMAALTQPHPTGVTG